MENEVEFHQYHTIMEFERADGKTVKGCTCQVWPDEVEIEDGEISHLADRTKDCPFRLP